MHGRIGNWKTETKADPFSLESLIAWLETMPADGTYRYTCNGHCLLAQYFTAMGFEEVAVQPYSFTCGDGGARIRFSDTFEHIAVDWLSFKKDYTFGAALARAKAVQS